MKGEGGAAWPKAGDESEAPTRPVLTRVNGPTNSEARAENR